MCICIDMQAIFYGVNPLGWGTCKWLRYFWPGCLLTPLNGLKLREVPAPELPADDWVRVRTLMGGICGTDLGLIAQKQPANSILQAYSTLPAVMGHENVAVVDRVGPAVDQSWLGRRVCVDPTLCCAVRGIDPPCRNCQAGRYSACENFGEDGKGTAGLPPGTSIGYNARTGGAYGEYFLAHVSQLVAVPDGLSDEQVVLTDPISCSLHAVLRTDLAEARRVLVYGAGVLGLGVISSLRALGYSGQIDALGRAGYLEALSISLGADRLVRLPDRAEKRFTRIAELTGASVKRVRFGNHTLSGGYDVVFDCVGSRQSINEGLKWTRSRGQVVLIGTGHGGRVDLTSLWFTELTVLGAYGREMEDYNGKRVGTYQLVHELMGSGKLKVDGLLTHTFRLSEYRQAFTVGLHKRKYRAVKVAFDFRGRQTAAPRPGTGAENP